ncbi:diguanylate cyclase [Solimonas sp. K1W22B-7]|uniref:diguanylate cyclase domain-containing protein n=1 Tax=Solimonas sp. K1W22B-7 TaxID=2303331 RepID=UPI000E32F72E|nr:diguanylate cyclase [Solimonas sp. K1W22B-7]AXQ29857.1 diguanylate cyclase [Solimonas sp. K1W22B-7]
MTEPTRPKILVVDDTPANLVAMRRLLAKVDAQLVEVDSGNAALAATLDHEFALVLLDVNMPDMDGFEVASHLAEEETTRNTPVIFVTAAMVDDLHRLKGYSFGAVDYIAKPINDTILLSKVRVFLELYRGKQQLQKLVRELEAEVSMRKQAEEQVRHKATHDALTGLPNRALFLDRLDTALERARRAQRSFALMYIDIDGFKPVNDTHGHLAGDHLLQAIAERLRSRMRRSDTVARLGGDEFAVIMEEAVEAPASALNAAEQLCLLLREPYDLEGGIHVSVGASIGVACHMAQAGGEAAGNPSDALIRLADDAMYRAKRGGKNRCELARP